MFFPYNQNQMSSMILQCWTPLIICILRGSVALMERILWTDKVMRCPCLVKLSEILEKSPCTEG